MNEVSFPAGAFWIGSAHPFDLNEAYLDFRRTFQIEQVPSLASLFITADSRYRLWVNGHFVARGPARCFPHAQSVDELDVAPYLQPGLNLLAVQVYQPGYSHFAYVHRGTAGLLANLECNGESLLTSDTRWRVRRNLSFASRVDRVSIYSSGVEERDLGLEDEWIEVRYDDAGWSAPRTVAPVGGYPWTTLEPRAVPLLTEREQEMRLLETRRGATPSDPDAHNALRQGWSAAQPQAIAAEEAGWFAAEAGTGEAAYWLFDLGRDYACQGWAEVEGAGGRESLSVSYVEKIRDGQLVLSDPDTYCRVRLTDRFHLRAGSQMAESFSLRGGRYLVFQFTGLTGKECRIRFHARVTEYPLEITHKLHSSDPLLSRIITMCEETFRACLLDGFVDSTWRESSQWIGDALPQALIMSEMSDDVRPLRRVIEMAAQGAYPDGVLPSVLPGEAHAYAVVDYNFMWVELLAAYWRLTRDRDFVTSMWPALRRMLEYFHPAQHAGGLIVSPPGRRLFLDWAPVSRNEPNAIYNLHYLLALQTAMELAHEMDESGDAAKWRGRADALRDAVRAAFWQDGRWYDDLQLTTFSQLAASLALLTDASEREEQEQMVETITARSLDDDDSAQPGRMVLASPFMHHYVFEALRCQGKRREVVDIIRSRWGRWAEAGYPTTWENWGVDFPDGSQCHAFSAHPRYHLAEIAREHRTL